MSVKAQQLYILIGNNDNSTVLSVNIALCEFNCSFTHAQPQLYWMNYIKPFIHEFIIILIISGYIIFTEIAKLRQEEQIIGKIPHTCVRNLINFETGNTSSIYCSIIFEECEIFRVSDLDMGQVRKMKLTFMWNHPRWSKLNDKWNPNCNVTMDKDIKFFVSQTNEMKFPSDNNIL